MTKNRSHLFPELDNALRTAYTTGVLPSQKILELVKTRHIFADSPIIEEQIQPASIDLRLGPVAYRVQASFLPGSSSSVVTSTLTKKVEELLIGTLDLTKPAIFETGCVYIVPLIEQLLLPDGISGKGNPRSTIGRLDVFTRLITEHGKEFEQVPLGYKGKLYVEIVPRTFTIILREGAKVNQLRLIRGNPRPSDTKLNKLNEKEPLVYVDNKPGKAHIQKGLRISINLLGKSRSEIIGYKAKKYAPVIDFEKSNYYDPKDFWEPVYGRKTKSLILNPGEFYVLASKDRIRIPPDFAAEMVAFDPSLGEYRIHYAGFFDPGFGYGLNNIKGTPAVMEVRAHEVPFLIEDGQTVGRLIYDRLLEPSDKIYGSKIGSSYQRQGLALSKQFKRGMT